MGYHFFAKISIFLTKMTSQKFVSLYAMNINSAPQPQMSCSIKTQIKHFVKKKSIQEPTCPAMQVGVILLCDTFWDFHL